MAGESFLWDAGKIVVNLKKLGPQLERAIIAATEYQATQGEAYMRKNASWTDRTTNARNGLYTKTFHEPEKHVITFYHTQPYGIWLEIRWSGRYAIILPSTRVAGTATMKMLNKMIERL